MLNSNGESGPPCHVLDLRGKALFFLVENDIHCGLFVYGFYDIEVCSLSAYTMNILIKEGCCTLLNAFSASIERIIWFLSFHLLM